MPCYESTGNSQMHLRGTFQILFPHWEARKNRLGPKLPGPFLNLFLEVVFFNFILARKICFSSALASYKRHLTLSLDLVSSNFIFKTATSITGSADILSLRPFLCHLCSCEVQARTGCSSSSSHKSLVFLLSLRENLHTLNIIMQAHECSILLGQLCRNILHEQLGLRQDINKSEDHEGPRMMALGSEIKMPFIAICLCIFYTLVGQKSFLPVLSLLE